MATRKKKITAVAPAGADQRGSIRDPNAIDIDDPGLSDEARAYADQVKANRAYAAELAKQMAPLQIPTPEDEEVDEAAEGPLVQAAKSGDRRLLLIAMRDRLAYMLEKTDSGRDVAAIARNLNIVSKELDEMTDPDAAETDPVEQMRQMVATKQAEE